MTDIIIQQLADPFRIGLLAFLLLTARNTAAATGLAIPLALGTLFIAFLIPFSFTREAPDLFARIGLGIVSNAILLGLMLGLYLLYRRLTGGRDTPSP